MEHSQAASFGALREAVLQEQIVTWNYRNSFTAALLGLATGKCACRAISKSRRASMVIMVTASVIAALATLAGVPCRAEAVENHAAAPTNRLELVMLEEQGCGYCRRWHQEVGPGYGRSDEGKRAPLKRVDLASTEATRFARVVYTPTFVLVRDGEERGRITGYPGADFFWTALSDRLRKLDQSNENPVEGPLDPFNPHQDCDD